MDHKKRSREGEEDHARKKQCPNLLSDLSKVLHEIKLTPSTGEISAELLETMKDLMLQIEHLSSDKTNSEAQHIKNESERCLESWLNDLVARCEADGVLFDDDFELSNDDDEALALALALEEHEVEDDEEEIVIIDDDEDNQTQIRLIA